MLYQKLPSGFVADFEVVSCFLECKDAILLLRRLEHKPQGGKWGGPAGKVDDGESREEAMLRELREETSIALSKEDIEFFSTVYVTHVGYNFQYHTYVATLLEYPAVMIQPSEHLEFQWISPKGALSIDLVEDMAECIKAYYRI